MFCYCCDIDANYCAQEQVVMGPLVEGERVVIVVIATRVITSSQNFSLVANGKSQVPEGNRT